MTQEYTLSEARQQLGTDNKTLQRWIDQAKAQGEDLEPHTNPRNLSQKLLTRSQLERLAALHGRKLSPEHLAKTTDPLAALERKLRREYDEKLDALREELLARIEELSSPRTATPAPQHPPVLPPAPSTSKSPQATEIIPAAAPIGSPEHAIQFLVQHQAPRTVVSRWRPIPFDKRELLQYALHVRHQVLQRCSEASQGCPCQELVPES